MKTYEEFWNEVEALEKKQQELFDETALEILGETGNIDRDWLTDLGYYTIDEHLESDAEESFYEMADEKDMKMFTMRGDVDTEGLDWIFVFAGARIEDGKPIFRYAYTNDDWDTNEWKIKDGITFADMDEGPSHGISKREAILDLYGLWDDYNTSKNQ